MSALLELELLALHEVLRYTLYVSYMLWIHLLLYIYGIARLVPSLEKMNTFSSSQGKAISYNFSNLASFLSP